MRKRQAVSALDHIKIRDGFKKWQVNLQLIQLTRFNGEQLWVNMDIIELVEETPDTIVTLTTGKKLVVKESAQIIRQQVLERRQSVFAPYDIQLHGGVTDGSR